MPSTPNTNIAELYEYTLQQMAAESYFEGLNLATASNDELRAQLRLGTNRVGYPPGSGSGTSSPNEGYPGYTRMTTAQADEFLSKYSVVHQWSDNPTPRGSRPAAEGSAAFDQLNDEILANTGLSATLIRKRNPDGSASTEYTLAIRSTEFRSWAEGGDGERDTTGADIKSILFSGFALAQQDALERYYAWLKQNGQLPSGAKLNVTGYSLGGNLATIFTEIHKSDTDIQFGEAVTINGAGRGSFYAGAGSLKDIVDYYHAVLSDPRLAPDPGGGIATSQRGAAIARLGAGFDTTTVYTDARYAWAVIATQIRFGLTFQSPTSESRTGTSADTLITQMFGFETINNTNFTANSGIHGPALRVGIESQPLLEGTGGFRDTVGDFGSGHSIALIADSLALQRVMHDLDPSFTLDRFIAAILPSATYRKPVNGAGANYETDALENVLDALRRIVVGPASSRTEFTDGAGGFGDITRREGFYANLAVLTTSTAFQALAGHVTVRAAQLLELSTLAQTDFSAIASLQSLSPIVLQGSDAAGRAALDSLWQTAAWNTNYQGWLSDSALRQSGEPAEHFTSNWLADRTLLLDALLERNNRDIGTGSVDLVSLTPNAAYDLNWSDATAVNNILQVQSTRPTPGVLQRRLITFGGDIDNTITGSAIQLGDHLYGGGGNDTLNGLAGDDYLEGNTGDDALDGGAGNDTLLGGVGTDTYTFNGTWSHDTLIDSDGLGTITVAGLGPLTGTDARKVAPDTWQTADRRVNYTLVPVDAVRSDLYISFSDRPDVITVRNWSAAKNLGLTLEPTITTDAAPAVDQTIALTDPPGSAGAYADLSASTLSYFVDGTPDGDRVIAGVGNDQVEGHGGGDRLSGNDGDDRLYADALIDIEAAIAAAQPAAVASTSSVLEGGRGEDLLIGGASNWLYGGAGHDTLIGGGAVDWVQGDSFDGGFTTAGVALTPVLDFDPVKGKYSFYVSQVAGGVTSYYGRLGSLDINGMGDVIVTGAGDDFADGELGDDRLSLGAGNDIGVGGAGVDAVRGEAGNDLMFGDFNADASPPTGSEPAQLLLNFAGLDGALHGQDLLDGGVGADVIWGNGAGDQLYGGSGADRLYGDDSITPGQFHGQDFLDGGSDDDELEGGGNDDVLFGGQGNDYLWGDFDQSGAAMLAFQGRDRLDGAEGNDQLVGGGNDDTLTGGAGNDNLWGDAADPTSLSVSAHGNDQLDGGDGDDQLIGGGRDDVLIGGAGSDSLCGDDSEANVSLALHGADWLDGGLGDDILSGQGGDDWLDGSDGADSLDGGNANDSLYGGAGNDSLLGGVGDDVLDGGQGADAMDGGAGDDTYRIAADETSDGAGYLDTIYATVGSDRLVLDGMAIDTVSVQQAPGGLLKLAWGTARGVHIDHGLTSSVQELTVGGVAMSLQQVVGERLLSVVNASTTAVGGRLFAGAAADTLNVAHAGTTVSGGRGDDRINLNTGGGSTVTLSVGEGVDRVTAVQRTLPATAGDPSPQNVLQLGAGFDAAALRIYALGATAFVLALNGEGDAIRFDAGDGSGSPIALAAWPFDAVRLADGSALTWQQILDRGVVPAAPVATAGNDVVTLTPIADIYYGADGDDTIDGMAGNDELNGDAGNDTLIGGAGNDTLRGGTGSNVLLGGDGDDFLIGGSLNAYDHSEGGEGNDSYAFYLGYGASVDGSATDASLTSDDTYVVGVYGAVGYLQQTWRINDAGGNDRLLLQSAVFNPTNTTVRYTGSALSITSWNLDVQIDGAITADGNVNATRGIWSVAFQNGAVWSASQLLAMSLQATAGNDAIHGYSGNDVIDGGDGTDTLWGGEGDDTLRGGAGGDTLYGEAGNDTLDGGGSLVGGSLLGGAGDDTYVVSRGAGNVYVGSDQRGSAENSGNDTLQLDVNADSVTFAIEAHTFKTEEDYLVLRWNDGSATARLLLEGGAASGFRGAVESIRFADGSTASLASILSGQTAVPTAGNDTLTFKSSDDLVSGGDGDDVLNGRGGNDRLDGGNGNDSLTGGAGDDVLAGGSGNDFLNGGDGVNTIEFGVGGGQDRVATQINGTNTLLLGSSITPGSVIVNWQPSPSFTSSIYGNPQWAATLQISLAGGLDHVASNVSNMVDFRYYGTSRFGIHSVQFQDGTTWDLRTLMDNANRATAGADALFDADAHDLLLGGDGNDSLYGLGGVNRLEGQGGNDTLYGGDENDVLVGGIGDDRLVGAQGVNTVEYARGDGNDLVFGTRTLVQFSEGITPDDVSVIRDSLGSVRLNVQGGGSIEVVVDRRDTGFDGARFDDGTYWTAGQVWDRALDGGGSDDHIVGFDVTNDTISGGGGNDVLEGGTGSDVLDGGVGDDTLYARQYGDFYAGGLTDTDVLIGGAGDDTLYGGIYAVDYRFDAGFGHDRIEPLFGAPDRDLSKRARAVFGPTILSSDIRVSRSVGGLVLSSISTGETIHVARFFNSLATNALSAAPLIDEVTFADGTTWISADLAVRVTSAPTATDDLVYGTPAADVIKAMAGNDLVYGGAGNDVIHGAAGTDSLYGEDGDDILIGGVGYDDVYGGAGNDRYEFSRGDGYDRVLDSEGSADVLAFGAGIATTDLQFTLGVPTNDGQTYALSLTGSADAVSMVGIDLLRFQDGTEWSAAQIDQEARTIRGTAGNDVLAGTSQNDRLLGLAGNDQLTGSFGDDLLDGGTGSDAMSGGAGNDTYIADATGDTISESSNQGTDTVLSSVTRTLGSNVENLTLTGSDALAGTGNTLANVITGNNAANALNGGTGADMLIGGAGNDGYTVDNVNDVIAELVNEGIDAVSSNVTYTLSAHVENLTLSGSSALNGTGNASDNILTGNSANNTLKGGAGNDTLNGGTGNDTMEGGVGDDLYVVNVATDLVTELANEGTDSVQSSATLTLGNNVENLTLTGTSALNGTGNLLDNVLVGNGGNNTLTGNAGNDTLNGGAGTDTMRGGAGNDTYVVERSADVVTENANEGTDTVQSSVTFTLTSTNLENLTLIGSTAINGTGNALANLLTGNSANNTLSGLAGNDTYAGGAGNDTLTDNSTSSDDIYRWGIGQGNDTLNDAGGSADRIEIAAGVVASQVTLTRSGNNLLVGLSGATDVLTVANWYFSAANKIEEIRLADGTVIGSGAAPLSLARLPGLSGRMQRLDDPSARALALDNTSLLNSAQSLVQAMAQFNAGAAADEPWMAMPHNGAKAYWLMPC